MSDTTDNVDDIVEERNKTLESALSQIKMQKGSSDDEARKSPSCLDWSMSQFMPGSSESSCNVEEGVTPQLEVLRQKEFLRNMQEHQEIQCLESQQERKKSFDDRAKGRSVSRRRKSPEKQVKRTEARSPPQPRDTKNGGDPKKSHFPPLPQRRPEKMVISGSLSDPPTVNTWEERKRKQSTLCELTPATTDDELNMFVKALEISKLDTGPPEKLSDASTDDEEALKEAIERSKRDIGPGILGFQDKPSENPSNDSVNCAPFEQPHYGNRSSDGHFRGMRRSGSRRGGRNRGCRGGRGGGGGGDRCPSPSGEMCHSRNSTDFRPSRGHWQHGDSRGHRAAPSGSHTGNYERAMSDTSEDWEKEMRENQKQHEVSSASSGFRQRTHVNNRPGGRGAASPQAVPNWREKIERLSERAPRKEDSEERPPFPGSRGRPTELRSHKFSAHPTIMHRDHDRVASVDENSVTTRGSDEAGGVEGAAATSSRLATSPSPQQHEPQGDKDGGDKKCVDVPFDVWLQMCDKYVPLLTKGMAHFQKSLNAYHSFGGAMNGGVPSPAESPPMAPVPQPHAMAGTVDMSQFPPYMMAHMSKDQTYITNRPPDKPYVPLPVPTAPNQGESYSFFPPWHPLMQMYMSQYPAQPVDPGAHYMSPGVVVNSAISKGQPQVPAPQLHPGHYAGPIHVANPPVLASSTKPAMYVPPPQHLYPPNSQQLENPVNSSSGSPPQVVSVTSGSKLNPQAQSFDYPNTPASGPSNASAFRPAGYRQTSNCRVRNPSSRQDTGLPFSNQIYAGKPRHSSQTTVRFPSPRGGCGHFMQDGPGRGAPQ